MEVKIKKSITTISLNLQRSKDVLGAGRGWHQWHRCPPLGTCNDGVRQQGKFPQNSNITHPKIEIKLKKSITTINHNPQYVVRRSEGLVLLTVLSPPSNDGMQRHNNSPQKLIITRPKIKIEIKKFNTTINHNLQRSKNVVVYWEGLVLKKVLSPAKLMQWRKAMTQQIPIKLDRNSSKKENKNKNSSTTINHNLQRSEDVVWRREGLVLLTVLCPVKRMHWWHATTTKIATKLDNDSSKKENKNYNITNHNLQRSKDVVRRWEGLASIPLLSPVKPMSLWHATTHQLPTKLDHNSSKNGNKNKTLDHNNQPQPAIEWRCYLVLGEAGIADSAVFGGAHAMMACDDSTNPLELDHNSSKSGNKNKTLEHNNQLQPSMERRCRQVLGGACIDDRAVTGEGHVMMACNMKWHNKSPQNVIMLLQKWNDNIKSWAQQSTTSYNGATMLFGARRGVHCWQCCLWWSACHDGMRRRNKSLQNLIVSPRERKTIRTLEHNNQPTHTKREYVLLCAGRDWHGWWHCLWWSACRDGMQQRNKSPQNLT